MQSSPNWGRLFEQGRCKAIGIPWSNEEAHAISFYHIPVEYVRNGCLTPDDYQKALNENNEQENNVGHKKPRYMKKEELIELASKLGIECDKNQVNRSDLILLIENAELPAEQAIS